VVSSSPNRTAESSPAAGVADFDALVKLCAGWLRVVLSPDGIAELRGLNYTRSPNDKWPKTYAGFFDHEHLDAMAAEALRRDKHCSGVYFMLNSVRRDLLARCANRAAEVPPKASVCATDGDIIGRTWLLVDADPVRPAGVSSTNEEKAWARAVVDAVRDHLAALG
jgi:hypothetical protein